MINYKKSHRLIATFLLLIFFPTLVPTNLFASNNGPVAPEAASFEPVDSSDMVNLATGDMSYVLPLLNVPSPEGGYPLALSYHAGIAMGQEASWVGLGWNLNPGAINRSVNNTPDDWNNGKTIDFVYSDLGTHDVVTIGLGVKYKMFNAGLDYTFVDGKGRGGIVSFGVGLKGASYGSSYGFGGYSGQSSASMTIGNLSISGNAKGEKSIGVNVLSISAGPYASAGMKITSQGISFSGSGNVSAGVGPVSVGLASGGSVSVGLGGISAGFSNTSYTDAHGVRTVQSSFNASLSISPVFSVRFGYSRVHQSMFDTQTSNINGVLYLKDSYQTWTPTNNEGPFNFKNDFMDAKSVDLKLYPEDHDTRKSVSAQLPYLTYDSYSVSAQGLIQNIQPMVFESKTIILPGANNAEIPMGYNNYTYNGGNTRDRYHAADLYQNKFSPSSGTQELKKIHFYPLNANSSYIDNSLSNFTYGGVLNNITDIMNSQTINPSISIGGQTNSGYDSNTNRLKKDSYIESYTNEEIMNNPNLIIEGNNFNRTEATSIANKGIGAFKVTTVDGKTYHYSIPVYNYEMFLRSYDTEKGDENKFAEKINTQPFATHWLLTAITGPDFVDKNSNGITDVDDYGYWVSFDYAKWTNSFVWKKETFNDKNIENNRSPRNGVCIDAPKPTNSRTLGVKQIYYLNAVNTRTHSALFIKSIKDDDRSSTYSKNSHYDDVESAIVTSQIAGYNVATVIYAQDTDYNYNISMNGQISTLKLDRIVLIKNEDKHYFNPYYQIVPEKQTTSSINITSHGDLYSISTYIGSTNVTLHQRTWIGGTYSSSQLLTSNTNMNLLYKKALKQIVFNQDYSLSKKANGQGKLSLKSVNVLGKNSENAIPPYVFDYYNIKPYNPDNYDLWGFDKNNPETYSLKSIKTPIGSVINVEYEKDDFSSVLREENIYADYYANNENDSMLEPVAESFTRTNNGNSGVVKMQWHNPCYTIGQIYECISVGNQIGFKLFKDGVEFNTQATIINISGDNITFNFNQTVPSFYSGNFYCCNYRMVCNSFYRLKLDYGNCQANNELLGKCNDSRGGLRVKNISTSLDDKQMSVNYNYNKPNTTVSSGMTASTPYLENNYTTFFPSGVYYEFVTVSYKDNNGFAPERHLFQFDVLKTNIDYDYYTFNTDTGIPNPNFSLGTNYFNSDGQILIQFGQFLKIILNQKKRNLNVINDYDELSNVSITSSTILDNTSKMGNLLSVTKLNSNNDVIEKSSFNYAESFIDDFGTYSESYKTFRSHKVYASNYYYDYFVNSSKIKVYPVKLLDKTIKNNGYDLKTNYDKYDFLTGQVLETTSTSSDGKSFKTKIVPAYTKYAPMGSKVDNINNKNMLSQTAAEYSYIWDTSVTSADKWRVTGVGITTWNNVWSYKDIGGNTSNPANEVGVWRKHKTYTWNGAVDPSTGIFTNYNNTNNDDDGFVWGVGLPQTNTRWKQISEVTLYDHYSMALEAKDINGNKASTKMGDNDTKIMATGNAGYNEMFYAGAENIMHNYWLEPEVRLQNGTRENNLAFVHTGKYSVKTTASSQFGVFMRDNEHKAGKYKLSVWVHNSSLDKARIRASYSGNPEPFNGERYKAGDWTLLTQTFDVGTIAHFPYLCSVDTTPVYYDDLMIRPVASSITGYVYNEWDELTYIIGDNGLATKFEYDAAGRLINTYSEVIDDAANLIIGGFKLVKTNGYHYKNLP